MTTFARRLVMLAVVFAAALPAAAQEFFPGFKAPDGAVVVDMKTYRAMALTQRLWVLQDSRRRLEADLAVEATAIQTLAAAALLSGRTLKAFGVERVDELGPAVQAMSATGLKAKLDAAASISFELPARYIGPLKRAVAARGQMDAIDSQIKQVNAQIAALE